MASAANSGWHPVTSWTREHAAHQQTLLTLRVPEPFRRGYTTAGQYLHVRTPDGEGFFALASVPHAALELLVKDTSSASHWLTHAPVGTPFETAEVAGPGFYWEDLTRDHRVVLCATGSGIAPIRPLFHQLLAKGIKPTLLYGGTDPGALAFADELVAAGDKHGADVQLFISQGTPEPHQTRGRLITALTAPLIDKHRTIAFLCGVRPMIVEATVMLTDLGVASHNIRLND